MPSGYHTVEGESLSAYKDDQFLVTRYTRYRVVAYTCKKIAVTTTTKELESTIRLLIYYCTNKDSLDHLDCFWQIHTTSARIYNWSGKQSYKNLGLSFFESH